MGWLGADTERLERFRQGDRATLAEVYAHYAPQLVKALANGFSYDGQRFAALSSAFEVDDILQETFIRAFSESSRASLDPKRPFQALLFTIARNLMIDRHRHLMRHQELLAKEDGEAERAPPPEKLVLDRELEALYQAFRASLTEKDLHLFQLRFENRVTRREVTARTGLTAMQIRVREAKLKQRLSAFLRKSGYLRSGLMETP